jgi:hypothetical protein
MKVKRWVLGVGVTMGAKRLGFGVGRAWRNLEEGRKVQSIAENDNGYAITCLINLLTTSDTNGSSASQEFPFFMETDVSLDLAKATQLSPSSARLIKSTSFWPIYDGPSLILSSHLSQVF